MIFVLFSLLFFLVQTALAFEETPDLQACLFR